MNKFFISVLIAVLLMFFAPTLPTIMGIDDGGVVIAGVGNGHGRGHGRGHDSHGRGHGYGHDKNGCGENSTSDIQDVSDPVSRDSDLESIGNVSAGCTDHDIVIYGRRNCDRTVMVYRNGEGFVPSSIVK